MAQDVLKKVVKAAMSKKSTTTSNYNRGRDIQCATGYSRSKGVDLAADLKAAMRKKR